MKRRLSRLSRLLTLAAAGIACSNDADIAKPPDGAGGGSQTCTTGQTQTCVGSAACKGGQVCTAQGTWGACDCGAAGHAGSSGASGHGGSVGGQGGASGHGGNVAGHGGAAGHGAGAGGSGGATPGTGGASGSAGGGGQGGSGGVAGSGGAAGGSSGTGGTGLAGGSGGTSTGQGGGGSSGVGVGGAAGSGGSSGGSSGSSGAAGTSGASGSPCASGGSSGAGGSGGSAEIPILPRCGDHTNNCAVGGPVDPMCNECTSLIAAGTHCQVAWDASCIAATKNLGNQCTVCSDPCNDPLPHTPCEVGVKLPSCANNLCTSDVCQTDPTCCSSAWSASCAATAMADMNCTTACAPPPTPAVYDVTNGKLTLVDSQSTLNGGLPDIIIDGAIDYAATGNFASTWVNEVGPRNSIHHQFAVDDTNFYVAVGGGAHKSAPKTGAIPKATAADRIFLDGTTLYIASGSTIYSASVTGPNATVLETADNVCADVVGPGQCSNFSYRVDDLVVQDGYVFWYLRAVPPPPGNSLLGVIRTPLAGGPSTVLHKPAPVGIGNGGGSYWLGTGPANDVYAVEQQPGVYKYQVLRIDTAAGTVTVLAQNLLSGFGAIPPVADDTGVYIATIDGVKRVTACGSTEDVVLAKKDGCQYVFDNVTLFPQAIYFSLTSVGCSLQTHSLYRYAR